MVRLYLQLMMLRAWAERGEKVVLVRLETSPEDITGMKAAQGILTVRGGMTCSRSRSCPWYGYMLCIWMW